jgi:hypothetical protein
MKKNSREKKEERGQEEEGEEVVMVVGVMINSKQISAFISCSDLAQMASGI